MNDSRNKRLEQKKQHYQQNKETINQKQNIVCHCECGGTYTSRHKQRHMNSIKHNTKMEQQQTQ